MTRHLGTYSKLYVVRQDNAGPRTACTFLDYLPAVANISLPASSADLSPVDHAWYLVVNTFRQFKMSQKATVRNVRQMRLEDFLLTEGNFNRNDHHVSKVHMYLLSFIVVCLIKYEIFYELKALKFFYTV